MTINIDFSVGDKVIVKELQRPGRIDMIQVDSIGVQYRVGFWDNATRQNAWLYADELEARP